MKTGRSSSVAGLLLEGRRRLAGLTTSPDLDAEVILADVLGLDRAKLLAMTEQPADDAVVAQYLSRLRRRRQAVPVAYLTGRREFHGLSLVITPDVLVPRPTTELLVEAILSRLPSPTDLTVVDVGTGSGAIALAVAAARPDVSVIATDISATALAIAQNNARRLGLERVSFRRGSLLEPIRSLDQPFVIAANLPYLKTAELTEQTIRHEPRLALDGGPDGLEVMNACLDQATNFPKLRGLVTECAPDQQPAIEERLRQHWPSAQQDVLSDGWDVRGLVAWLG